MDPQDSSHGDSAAVELGGTGSTLKDTGAGRWQVTTRTSIYLIDLDRRAVMRISGTAGEHGIDREGDVIYYVATLEGDRRTLPLGRLHTCVVGADMYLFTGENSRPNLRHSTPVREIRRHLSPS